ncbi:MULTISPECIES: DUF2884 family protein [unclassified Lysobacter]|uniref:DUF2884 family protein n=1 Tax=unclassified Lysobacter TaxID=2635362 RepID=UPI001BE75EA4|nr:MULTISPECIES: DUF2884 family protein [unclassified Lysobacter]MBT2748040.1 DUF2884 family protein [Lysobacter sp. ISL-42]MBT2752748.1 DUF2884 family protein [Lysobacter sp. ISL-50]MBT2779337.1 DUF2884 family protein [Lysobacter sp. ISL-54]MBT2781892.1 DUF2884 family protein [Lysobacter sp. ISL-52]
MKAPLSLLHPATLLAVLALTVSNAGCSKSPERSLHVSVIDHISVVGDDVRVKGDGEHRADIAADGALSIDGKAQTLSAAQQAISRRYYEQVVGIGQDGAAMGKAGAAMAGQAVSTAFEELSKGKPEEIGKKVEAEASKLQAQAMKMCDRVASLRTAQDELRASLPAFAPFAKIDADVAKDCRR